MQGEIDRGFRNRVAPGLRMAVAAVLLLAGCSTNRVPLIRLYGTGPETGVERQLRQNARKWLGVPYRYGGDSRRGIDCSALVARLYDATFDVRLPRTVRRQMAAGQPVGKRPLAPGDIVFFKTGFRNIHVGVYLGRGEFVHASSRKGVIVSSIFNQYWRRHYLAARRVVAER